MHIYCNVGVHLDLCILDSSQIVIPFNPLGLHFLLFTVVQIFWNVVAVTGSIIVSLNNLLFVSLRGYYIC